MGRRGSEIKLPYLQTFTARGKRFAYYRRSGRRVRIPGEIGSADWLAAYQRVHATFEHRGPGQPPRGSVAAVVAEFKGSPEFRQLSPLTQRDYRRHLEDIASRCGPLPIAELPRSFVLALRDRYASTPRKANYVLAVLRRLLSFAVDRGYRPGDLVCLTRGDYRDGWLSLRQSKTGQAVDIPAAPALRSVLDPWLASHGALVMLVTRTGRPFTADHFKHTMARAYAAAGLTGVTTHGLRHTTATLLAEAGCDWPTIAAVTGHRTAEMVRRYTARRRNAASAVEHLAKREKE